MKKVVIVGVEGSGKAVMLADWQNGSALSKSRRHRAC